MLPAAASHFRASLAGQIGLGSIQPSWVAEIIASLAHRHVWQRFPQSWRRETLFRITASLAPKPEPNIRPALPVIVVGALRTVSGLGQGARLCHDALKSAGLPVFGIDLSRALMQPDDLPEFEFADGRAIQGPATLIVHVNSPLLPLAMMRLGRRLLRNKHIIGYWNWELPAAPPDWRFGMPFVHGIWVPSRFTADALKSVADGRPIGVLPLPVADAEAAPSKMRGESTPFTVLTILDVASSFARKNPCAAIEAFRMAFGNDPNARLVLKTSNLSTFPEGAELIGAAIRGAENIRHIETRLKPAEIASLYDDADVVLSLHRSEGFGLTLVEAMSKGLPVVATDWSGSTDVVAGNHAVPIGFRLVPARDPQGSYDFPQMQWAEADIEEAARALRRLRDDPTLRAELGSRASAFARSNWNATRYAATARQLLGI